MGRKNHYLLLDAAIMVLANCPIIGVVISAVLCWQGRVGRQLDLWSRLKFSNIRLNYIRLIWRTLLLAYFREQFSVNL